MREADECAGLVATTLFRQPRFAQRVIEVAIVFSMFERGERSHRRRNRYGGVHPKQFGDLCLSLFGVAQLCVGCCQPEMSPV